MSCRGGNVWRNRIQRLMCSICVQMHRRTLPNIYSTNIDAHDILSALIRFHPALLIPRSLNFERGPKSDDIALQQKTTR
jgi:hypothetical protein